MYIQDCELSGTIENTQKMQLITAAFVETAATKTTMDRARIAKVNNFL